MEATRLQHRDDRKTENGRVREKQAEWNRSTQQALRQLGVR